WNGSKYDSYGRIYDNTGSIVVETNNIIAANSGALPTFTELSNGKILLTWNYYLNGTARTETYGQIYNADGSIDVPIFTVNAGSAGDQHATTSAALEDGGFVVSWQVYADGPIFMRLFNAQGHATTGDIQVSSGSTANFYSDIATLPDGTFVVFWEQSDAGSGVNIYGQRYDADGNSIGDSFTAHTDATGTQSFLDADVNVAGDVVVSYQSDTGDGNGFDIQLRVL
ncbi:hypothetical protein MF542_17485, partial [Kordiimonas sp. 5E331]